MANLLSSNYEDFNIIEQDDFENSDIQGLISLFHVEDAEGIKSTKNPFDINPELAKTLYSLNFQFSKHTSYLMGSITITATWGKATRLYTFNEENLTGECQSKIAELVEKIQKRVVGMGGSVENNIYVIPTLDVGLMANKVKTSKNEEAKRDIFNSHMSDMFDCYIDLEQRETAISHAKTALLISEPDNGVDANDVGYVLMSGNLLEAARPFFHKSISLIENEKETNALPDYNLAILMAQENENNEAYKLLLIAKDKAEKMSDAELKCSCLFVPAIEDQVLKFNEILHPNLLDTINEAIAVLKHFSQQ